MFYFKKIICSNKFKFSLKHSSVVKSIKNEIFKLLSGHKRGRYKTVSKNDYNYLLSFLIYPYGGKTKIVKFLLRVSKNSSKK